MSLNIMIAGCSKDERERIESAVRAAFAGRPDDEPWNVSLVNVANQWSIDIDGPEPNFKGVSLVAPADALTASLQEVIASNASAAAPSPTPTAAPAAVAGAPATAAPHAGGNGANGVVHATPAGGPRKDRHECEECAAAFEVIFDQQSGEPEELCPVACPACWHVNKVPIAEAAGATGDYRAQAIG